MKKLFYALTSLILTIIYANTVSAQYLNKAIFKNLCNACNSVCVTLIGPTTMSACTGAYGSEVGWEDFPPGNYTFNAYCASGISKTWQTTLFIENASFYNQGLNIICPEYDNATTTSIRRTTTTPSLDPCPASTIYGTDSLETQLLRSLRDNVLSKTHEGRELIKLYYQWSPLIVKAMEADEEFKQEIKDMIDGIMALIMSS